MCNNGFRRIKSFTLIELLVVIAIIAILASMLLPSLGKARESAKFMACMVKMRELGTAVQLYAGDYNGFIPAAGLPHIYNDSPIVTLRPYGITSKAGCYACPSDKVPYVVDATHTYLGSTVDLYLGAHSYAYNGYMGCNWTSVKMYTLDSVGTPARIFLFTELNLGGWTFFTLSSKWYDAAWPDHSGYNAYGRHNNLTQNILLADGHVQRVKFMSTEYNQIEGDPNVLLGP